MSDDREWTHLHPILDARWASPSKYFAYYILEVFVVGKWRGMSVRARKPRKITQKEFREVRNSIRINTGGEKDGMVISGLRLSLKRN